MQPALKRIYTIIFIMALLYAGLGTYFLAWDVYPFQLKTIGEPVSVKNTTKVYYHDFDSDGESEKIVVRNKKTIEDSYHINIYKEKTGLINQWNIRDSILIRNLAFVDVNHDNVDELLVWSQGRDSLFLSILDIRNPENEQLRDAFVLRAPLDNPYKVWDIQVLKALVPKDQPGKMFFIMASGYSKAPRGIFTFDLNIQKVIDHFLCNAFLSQFTLFDINQDGREELIMGSSATSNFPDTALFSDAHSWILVLDQDLKLLFSYKSKTPYGNCSVLPGIVNNEHLIYDFFNYKDYKCELIVINNKFKIVQRRFFYGYLGLIFNSNEKDKLAVFLRGKRDSKYLDLNSALVTLDSTSLNDHAEISKIGRAHV